MTISKPSDIAVRYMLNRCQIRPGSRVLLPCGGVSSVTLQVAYSPGVNIVAIEENKKLYDLFLAGGGPVKTDTIALLYCDNFFDLEPEYPGNFDAVIYVPVQNEYMSIDAQRFRICNMARHALSFLKPGGYLVAYLDKGLVEVDGSSPWYNLSKWETATYVEGRKVPCSKNDDHRILTVRKSILPPLPGSVQLSKRRSE